MKNALLIALLCLCVYFAFCFKLKDRRITALEMQAATLEDNLKRHITFKAGKIVYKEREGTAVKAKTIYVPPEGSFELKQTASDTVQISVKNKGFTFLPFAAGFYASGIEPALGARLFYYNRFGLGAAWAQKNGPGIVFDRRLDDILPLTKNTSIMFFVNRSTVAAGIAVYF